jgi:hypothetical protein
MPWCSVTRFSCRQTCTFLNGPTVIQPSSGIGVGYSNKGAVQVMVLSEGLVRDLPEYERSEKNSPKSVW